MGKLTGITLPGDILNPLKPERRIDMPREMENFRANLDRLDEAFPSKNVLSISDVVRYTEQNYRTVKKFFPFKKGFGISKVSVARILSSN